MDFTRSITFTIPGSKGSPGVLISAIEENGNLVFTVDIIDSAAVTADLRGLFFDVNNPSKLAGLTWTGSAPISGMKAAPDSVIDLGNGANMQGARKGGFDVGLEFGEEGIGKGKLDVNGPVKFTLSNTAHNLTLDDIANTLFGARLTSVGAPGGARNDSAKLTFVAPAAPDAVKDTYNIFEDGQTGLSSPSHTPAGVIFQVLKNDTDADGDVLTIDHVKGALHGTVQIIDGDDADSLVGDAILYTPDQDYSGSDSFTYSITDNHGGTDFAQVDVNVAAVADIPGLTYEIMEGDTVNQIRVRVTATQMDADSSEFIDRIELSGYPEGVTVSAASVNPGDEPNELVHEFVLTLPPSTDVSFNLGITAVSKETSNGDEQGKTVSVPIVLENTLTTRTETYQATDQSIWSTGGQFTFTDDRFLGIDESWNKDGGGLIYGHTDGHIKAGFQSTLEFEGGEIDASTAYDLSVETSYNKTTDVLFLTADATLGSASFTTEGPEGSYTLDFLFDFLMNYSGGVDLGEVLGKHPVISGTLDEGPHEVNILDLTSDDLTFTVGLPLGFSLDFAWPDIDTTSSLPSTQNPAISSGASNNFLELGLDVDELLFSILKIPNPFDIPIDLLIAKGNAELLDLDLSAGLNFLQEFQMMVDSLTGTITFEDGTSQAFNFTDDIKISNASTLDDDGDGKIAYELELAPNATLNNDTDLGFNVGYQFDALKLSGSYNIGVKSGSLDLGPVFTSSGTAPVASVSVYDQTFGLNFQEKDFLLVA